jgi:hypothetical protein
MTGPMGHHNNSANNKRDLPHYKKQTKEQKQHNTKLYIICKGAWKNQGLFISIQNNIIPESCAKL